MFLSGTMEYPSGHKRTGYLDNDLWKGEVKYEEEGVNNQGWIEVWEGNRYLPSVKIFKKVKNNYTDISVRNLQSLFIVIL